MDPNATLRELRELAGKVLTDEYPDLDEVRRLAELIEAMDSWLSSAGFFPTAWNLPWTRAQQAAR